MKRVMRTAVVVLGSLAVFLSHGKAWPQPVTEEEIFAYLAKEGPARGSDKAPVALIEFSDFQCSFCRRFWQETLPSLDTAYIKKGKLRFLYRHFAILGKPSVAAAQAAECAGEQGKFWSYHDKLFASAPSPLAFTSSKLKRYAEAMGLKGQDFGQCLDSGKYAKKVEGETAMAAFLGARGTPTFFLNGNLIAGAQPFGFFEPAIESLLKKSPSGKSKP